MELDYNNFYVNTQKIIKGSTIDLSEVKNFHSWSIVLVCLLLIERMSDPNKKLILPENPETKIYLKNLGFYKILKELNYHDETETLRNINISDDKAKSYELIHCLYRDEFNARLGGFIDMFKDFGLTENDAQRATAMVGELGNNVFDHNLGNWPTNISGCIIASEHNPSKHSIEIAIGDPGVGFYRSLKTAFPDLTNDIDAIKLGLAGNTGRVGEKRGNGLRLTQQWAIQNFSGLVMIHSGEGMVIVDKSGIKEKSVNKILGTVVQFVINYK